jgi:hypothetical protein
MCCGICCLNEKGAPACSHWTGETVGPNTFSMLTLPLTETYYLSYPVCSVIVISRVFSLWGVIRKCLCGDPGAVSVSLFCPVESGKQFTTLHQTESNKYITSYLVVLDSITHTLLCCHQHNGMDSNEYNIKLYLTTHNTHNRQTSMLLVGFEPTMTAGKQLQTTQPLGLA